MTIPDKIRRIENLHILFWLSKDLCWCFEWKWLGIIMIFPTLSLCVFTTWKMKNNVTETFHNLAVLCWIIANSYWMLSEFFQFDETIIFENVVGKQLALIPFCTGILILIYFYLFKDKR
jgi:hypothetical protein